MERRNINRGFKQLRVWQDAVALYVLACEIFRNFPYELKKFVSNAIDAAHSVSRNMQPVQKLIYRILETQYIAVRDRN